MDLERQLLLRQLADHGYPLVLPSSATVEQTLHQALVSDDTRLVEGIPVVLANVLMRDPTFRLAEFENALPKALQRRFRTLVAFTFIMMVLVPESERARERLSRYLIDREPALLEQVQLKVINGLPLSVGQGLTLDPERLENTFRNYVLTTLSNNRQSIERQLADEREAVFLAALKQLFTARQTELLLKLLNKQPLSKTEREYYSRSVKPRLKALANPDLQALAATLLSR
jgi:hypothetical protein